MSGLVERLILKNEPIGRARSRGFPACRHRNDRLRGPICKYDSERQPLIQSGRSLRSKECVDGGLVIGGWRSQNFDVGHGTRGHPQVLRQPDLYDSQPDDCAHPQGPRKKGHDSLPLLLRRLYPPAPGLSIAISAGCTFCLQISSFQSAPASFHKNKELLHLKGLTVNSSSLTRQREPI